MLRLRDGLTVQFKNQFRMTSLQKFRFDVLVAGDASVRADVEIFQVAHPGGNAKFVRVIRPCVRADPILRRAVTVFARDAFFNFEVGRFEFVGNRLDRRVTNGATVAPRRILDFQNVGDAFGARGGERGDRALMMEIALRPDGELFAVVARAAVTTARAATLRAKKFWFGCWAFSACGGNENGCKKRSAPTAT